MKFNKLIAAMSAVTMLGSLAVAVPASAKTVEGTVTQNVSVVAQLRATDDTYATKHNSTNAIKATTDNIEVRNSSYTFGFYSFESLGLPEDAVVTSATLGIYKASNNNHNGVSYQVKAVDITNVNLTDVTAIFNASRGETAITSNNSVGDANDPKYRVTADVTSITSASKANGFIVYNPTPEGNRDLGANADLEISYSYEEPDDPVAQIGETKYESFEAAFAAAKAGDTIKLLADVETEGRFVLDSGTANAPTYKNNISPLTIDGNGNTITAKKANNYAFLFETSGKTLNLNNITIINERTYVVNAKGSSTINLKDASVPAPIFNTNGATGTFNATNLNVANAADGVSLFNDSSTWGTVNVSLTEALAAQYDVVEGALKAKAVEPETTDKYFTFTGEDGASYRTVVVNATKGEDTQDGTAELSTTVTGGSIAIAITGVPVDVTINSVTLQ